MLNASPEVAQTPCPKYRCTTLAVEAILRSGIKLSCEGWDPASSEGENCSFQYFSMVTNSDELPSMSIVDAKVTS